MKVINYADAVKSIMAHDEGEEVRDSLKKAEALLDMAKAYEMEDTVITNWKQVHNTEWECAVCGYRLTDARHKAIWLYCPHCGAKIEK